MFSTGQVQKVRKILGHMKRELCFACQIARNQKIVDYQEAQNSDFELRLLHFSTLDDIEHWFEESWEPTKCMFLQAMSLEG